MLDPVVSSGDLAVKQEATRGMSVEMGDFHLPKEDLPFLAVALVGALRFSLQEHKRRGISAEERAALYDQISDQIMEMGFARKDGTPRMRLSEIPSASPLQRRIAAVIDQVFDEAFSS